MRDPKEPISRRARRRRLTNSLATCFAYGALITALSFLMWIVLSVIQKGFAGLTLDTLLQMTPPPGSQGGLANAIFGSLYMTFGAMLFATPVGILAGVYLTQHTNQVLRTASVLRFLNDMLLSAPSIVLGLYVYEVYVVNVKHFSAFAGMMALALIALPIMTRTTEDMLRLVPFTLQEAAYGLGATRWEVFSKILLRISKTGLITGVLLAVARISGETAPLLFTALNNQFWSTKLGAPMANLPTVIFQFAMSPYADWQQLAWAGAALIMLWVLALNIIARSLSSSSGPSY
ncbi:MAG: phosphate ABC transporter, permease protein PstA [Candidatus Puniceispirillum sp.]|nr:phosphate ABC transporter, permease protein PstA [Candidatus Puniceispirillum sp.]